MKFKEIKDLIEESTKIIIEGEKIAKRSNIGWLNQNEYDNYEIDSITTSGIIIKWPDKYKKIREFIKDTKLNGKEEICMFCDEGLIGIQVIDEYDPGEVCPARLEIYNANTLEEKIEVLKILYGDDDEA